MANVGSAAAGQVYIGAGNGASGRYASIGTNSGLTAHGVVIAEGNSPFVIANPNTSGFVLTSNGAGVDPSFQAVSSSGAIITITGDTGGPESPLAGNFNILGTGSITVVGSANTETVQLTGLTNNAVLVGAGTATITKVGPVNSAALVSTSAGVPIWSSTMTNGQMIIGSTGATPAAGMITSTGGTIAVTTGAGTLNLETVNGGFVWNDVSGAFSPLKNNGYFVTGTATGTLPASPAQGDTIKFFVDHASQVLTIDAPGTQLIRMGSLVTSAGGTAVSTQQGDSVELVYRAANTCWEAVCGFNGTWIIS